MHACSVPVQSIKRLSHFVAHQLLLTMQFPFKEHSEKSASLLAYKLLLTMQNPLQSIESFPSISIVAERKGTQRKSLRHYHVSFCEKKQPRCLWSVTAGQIMSEATVVVALNAAIPSCLFRQRLPLGHLTVYSCLFFSEESSYCSCSPFRPSVT